MTRPFRFHCWCEGDGCFCPDIDYPDEPMGAAEQAEADELARAAEREAREVWESLMDEITSLESLMDEITRKWAAWAEAAEEYAKAACSEEQAEQGKDARRTRILAAIGALGSDPCGVVEGKPR